MAGVVHDTRSIPRPADGVRQAPVSARILVPAVAFVLVLIGLILFIDPSSSVGPFVPFTCYAVGLGVLTGSAAFFAWQSTLPPPKKAGETEGARAVAPVRDRTNAPGVRPARRPLFSPSNRGSEWRVLSTPTSPGDETWLSWLPREHRRLGPEAAGMAPSGSYAPSGLGGLVAIPLRKSPQGFWAGTGAFPATSRSAAARPIPVEVGGTPYSAAPIRTPEPAPTPPLPGTRAFSDEELDRMFPPAPDRPSLFLSNPPAKVGVSESLARHLGPRAEGTPRSARPGYLYEEEGSLSELPPEPFAIASRPVSEDPEPFGPGEAAGSSLSTGHDEALGPPSAGSDLSLESTNPVPPHLRAEFAQSEIESRPHASRSAEPGGPKSVCASCSKVVVSLRMSGPCPRCLRPICRDCLGEALRTVGHGWCEDCSLARDRSAN